MAGLLAQGLAVGAACFVFSRLQPQINVRRNPEQALEC